MESLDSRLRRMCENNFKYLLPDIKGYRTFQEYLDVNNFTDDTIAEDAIDFYYKYNINHHFNRYSILESLVSRDASILIKKLSKFDDVLSCTRGSSNTDSINIPIEILVRRNNSIIDDTCFDGDNSKCKILDNAKEFLKLIEFFKYYVTLTKKVPNGYIIYLEPETTKDVFRDCQKDGGYIYYVTDRKNLNHILKRGLVPVCGRSELDGGYRYFPKRLYFIRHNKNKSILKKNIWDIICDKELEDDYIILKISLKSRNIGLYIDTAYDTSNNVYTIESIPPQLIEVIFDIEKI